jgi:hypothetical protein
MLYYSFVVCCFGFSGTGFCCTNGSSLLTVCLPFADITLPLGIFEICDGTEPTISELLTNPATFFRDISGNGVKGDLKNGVQQIRSNLGALTFDGTDDYRKSVQINGVPLRLW